MLPLSLLALILILTKIADIVTTVSGIRRAGGSVAWERNPFARLAMERWGLGGGFAFILLLWTLVVALCYGPAFFAPRGYQIATALCGLAIAWAQWDVARMNVSGRHSRFTRLALHLFERHATDPLCMGTSPDIRRHACFDFNAMKTS